MPISNHIDPEAELQEMSQVELNEFCLKRMRQIKHSRGRTRFVLMPKDGDTPFSSSLFSLPKHTTWITPGWWCGSFIFYCGDCQQASLDSGCECEEVCDGCI